MPYRRLPNTDTTRIKALERAVELANKISYTQLAFSQSLYIKIKAFLPSFVQAINDQKNASSRQTKNSKDYKESMKKAKLYISHFLQVFNFAVQRGEISPKSREYFGLGSKDSKLPDLNTENDIIEWGKKVIEGENCRKLKREPVITCPKIEVVKVYYDEFKDKMNFQKMLQTITARTNDKVSELRPRADELILALWNEIEAYYAGEPIDKLREFAAFYGVNYVYRPKEREALKAKVG